MLVLDGVTRTLRQKTAVSDVSSAIRSGQLRRRHRPLRRRQVDAAAHDQPAGRSERRPHPLRRDRRHRAARARSCAHWRARCAMIFQQFNLVGRLDVLTNVLMGRLADVPTWRALLSCGPTRTRRSRSRRSSSSTSRASPRSAPTSSPAASSSASPSPARWCRSRTSSWPTSRSPRSIRATRAIVMDALLRINKHFGITVICNLHSLDLARGYCDRAGRHGGRPRRVRRRAGRAHRRGRARALRPRGRRGDGRRAGAAEIAARVAGLSAWHVAAAPEVRASVTTRCQRSSQQAPGETHHARSSQHLSSAPLSPPGALAASARARAGLEGASIPSSSSPWSRPRTPPARRDR